METVTGKRALLVEDEAPLRELLVRHLRRLGLEVTALESAEEAVLEGVRLATGFDVVISDVHLPGMSGLDLVSLILSRSPSQPVIVMTGDPDAALAREALARGPVSYLLKPFELFELDAAVNQALLRQRLNPQIERQPVEETPGRVPQRWLDAVDQQSYAGSGHARRVGRISLALAEVATETAARVDVAEMLIAAWSHELGRLKAEVSDPVVMAGAGADLLAQVGCAPGVVAGVRHLHERYDGTGAPAGLVGAAIPAASLILAVADSIEHYVAAWLLSGREHVEAVDRALGLIRVQRGAVFSPDVVDAAQRQRSRILDICREYRVPPGANAQLAGVDAEAETHTAVG